MERLAELIGKLKEQFEQNADTSKLLGITLLIERELMKMEPAAQPVMSSSSSSSSSKVAVVMPAARNGYQQPAGNIAVEEAPEWPAKTAAEPKQATDWPAKPARQVNEPPEWPTKPAREEKQPAEWPAKPAFEDRKAPPGQQQEAPVQAEQPPSKPQPQPPAKPQPQPAAKQEELVQRQQPVAEEQPAEKKDRSAEFHYNPIMEIPTLSQQHSIKEINEMIGLRDASLNDKLKQNNREVAHVLTEHPIKDLKKAIGINDRYVFISELFRGDEVMYERSLKTINAFRIFAEAEYWIERELKVKLGWEEHKETTRHFYQLVKRRFS